MTRPYDNRRRAQAAAATSERIVAATEHLLAEGSYAELTLVAIAARAGVTAQTVLRKMGSREGCIAAAGARFLARVESQRGQSAPGNVAAALDGLLSHYESDGRLVLNLLAQEPRDAGAREAVASGRAYHEAWVRRCFAPFLAERPGLFDSLLVATDLYTWKRLRLDLGRSAADTRVVVEALVHAILEHK